VKKNAQVEWLHLMCSQVVACNGSSLFLVNAYGEIFVGSDGTWTLGGQARLTLFTPTHRMALAAGGGDSGGSTSTTGVFVPDTTDCQASAICRGRRSRQSPHFRRTA